MDKFDRIYALDSLLNRNKYPVTMAKIMATLECSKATAKRIIEHMRTFLSAPIDYYREYNGYSYNKQSENTFELPGIWFNTSELHALLTAQILLERVDPGLYSEQLKPLHNKIETILEKAHGNENKHENYQRIRILSLAKRKFDNHIFQHIATTVIQRKQLHIHYRGRQNSHPSERNISPQRLVHYRDNWYLDAWCHVRNNYRTFAVERIEQATPLNKKAKNIPEKELDDYFSSAFGIFSGEAKHTAVLHFTPERARWVAEEEWHPNQQSKWLDNGYYELRLPYGNATELIMDILKYGTDVEVIKPASLRNAVKRRIYAMTQLYQ